MQAPAKQILRRVTSPLRKFPTPSYQPHPPAKKLEEESWPWYHPGLFYPVRIGEVFRSQYQVISKLGYGSRSTAWLCRDLKEHRYVALKVCERNWQPKRREAAAYARLASVQSRSPGSSLIRGTLDRFQITGPLGQHQCFVHEPLSVSLGEMQGAVAGHRLAPAVVRRALRHVLTGLDFLHGEAGMVHTDIQPWNVMHRPATDGVFTALEFAEMSKPSPCHLDAGGYPVHSSCALAAVVDDLSFPSSSSPSSSPSPPSPSRPAGLCRSRSAPSLASLGTPVLCDLGEARFGKKTYMAEIQPDVYRAPEVILEIPWDAKADVWNVGVMAWDLYANQRIFNGRDPKTGDVALETQLEQMVGVMGAPPPEFLARSRGLRADEYFDSDGNLRGREGAGGLAEHQHHHGHAPHHHDDVHVRLAGADEGFVKFVARMLRWVPEERPTAAELLKDDWLRETE